MTPEGMRAQRVQLLGPWSSPFGGQGRPGYGPTAGCDAPRAEHGGPGHLGLRLESVAGAESTFLPGGSGAQ